MKRRRWIRRTPGREESLISIEPEVAEPEHPEESVEPEPKAKPVETEPKAKPEPKAAKAGEPKASKAGEPKAARPSPSCEGWQPKASKAGEPRLRGWRAQGFEGWLQGRGWLQG